MDRIGLPAERAGDALHWLARPAVPMGSVRIGRLSVCERVSELASAPARQAPWRPLTLNGLRRKLWFSGLEHEETIRVDGWERDDVRELPKLHFLGKRFQGAERNSDITNNT